VAGTFAKSTPYLACGNGRPPQRLELLDKARLNGRLRNGNFDGNRDGFLLRLTLLAQGRGKDKRLDVDDLKRLSDFAHSVFS
jgi:hypothetical protein